MTMLLAKTHVYGTMIKVENTVSQMNLTNGHYKLTFRLKVLRASLPCLVCHVG